MSDHPATLGDLADLDHALRIQIDTLRTKLEKLEQRMNSDLEVTDEKIAGLRERLHQYAAWSELASGAIARLEGRVAALEKLWEVAQENPELVRELAAIALKGRERV